MYIPNHFYLLANKIQFHIHNWLLVIYYLSAQNHIKKLEAKGLRSPVNCQQLFDLAWSAQNKHGPKPISFINTISQIKIEGGIFFLSFLQRLSYNVYLTTAFSQYFTKRFSHNVFLHNFFLNVATSISQRLSHKVSHNVFPTTSSFLPFLRPSHTDCFTMSL